MTDLLDEMTDLRQRISAAEAENAKLREAITEAIDLGEVGFWARERFWKLLGENDGIS